LFAGFDYGKAIAKSAAQEMERDQQTTAAAPNNSNRGTI
jgi:hypothetical protein